MRSNTAQVRLGEFFLLLGDDFELDEFRDSFGGLRGDDESGERVGDFGDGSGSSSKLRDGFESFHFVGLDDFGPVNGDGDGRGFEFGEGSGGDRGDVSVSDVSNLTRGSFDLDDDGGLSGLLGGKEHLEVVESRPVGVVGSLDRFDESESIDHPERSGFGAVNNERLFCNGCESDQVSGRARKGGRCRR